ncbi:NADPH:quinone reductase-like Zn-dependent oxidoreductase [Algoriphagus ratkowskyi]|uniref:NADPH:quinone reductase-like Zn-dependent oxidoreductase n=1 Tax=Algoriphagus ratkowskyi TaxID=57028 RepID=A0A2W7R6D3_9BACT|nr:zinc-dependent alcohol dehydrogenase family protein [Algoriphagus ratkowskyi]PZX53890.1 NADPH:quinone reductase-like Zn-dependent oxidoreductase [Algoriphagus ratkowskyi]TXD76706.1 zinc-dependent alcohol dehydrogenase family protein [Algoriphagus ratkowskyi]
MIEVIFEKTGLPQDVLQVRESPAPEPKADEVQIQVKARNINPSDLMFIQGRYGIQPTLPSSAGFEAAGIVSKSDAEGKIPVGTRVMFTAQGTSTGTWREYITLPAKQVIPMPEGMSFEVACQAFVNPVTAVAMVNKSELKAGEWLLLTAGASAFGKFAIQVAKSKGIKVACTVRHDEQKTYLANLGADLVINTEKEDLRKVISDQVGEGVSAVFDAVGGELGAKALSCLKQFGAMYVFGVLSMQNMPLNTGMMIFKEITVEGFWLSSVLQRISKEERAKLYQETQSFLMSDDSTAEVAEKFPLSEVKAAIEAYNKPGRNGKILLVS